MKKILALCIAVLMVSTLLFGVSDSEIAEAAKTLNVPYEELKALVEKYAPLPEGSPSPIGTFAIGQTMFSRIVDAILVEEGISSSSPEYETMKALYEQILESLDLFSLAGMETDMHLVFTEYIVIFDGEPAPYRLDRLTRTVWMDLDGIEMPLGTFDEAYSIFTLMDEPLAAFDRVR
jgi:hypothetical protein